MVTVDVDDIRKLLGAGLELEKVDLLSFEEVRFSPLLVVDSWPLLVAVGHCGS